MISVTSCIMLLALKGMIKFIRNTYATSGSSMISVTSYIMLLALKGMIQVIIFIRNIVLNCVSSDILHVEIGADMPV